MATILEMKNITKQFGTVVANNNVSFTVEEGEVHALLGENGAGKSTLMNILFGLYEQTSGEILYKGRHVRIRSPRDAIDLGIGMVHQHFMLIPAHSAIENVVLGYAGNKPVLDLKAAAKRFTEMAERYHMEIDPWQKVSTLSVGQQQRLEILKALYRDVDMLILDEPTAVLTPPEVKGLFKVIRQLVSEGKTVIFITHKLPEIMEICDRCTVLRQGEVAAAGMKISDINNLNELAHLMVGRQVELVTAKQVSEPGEVVLRVEGLNYTNEKKLHVLKDISFDVRAGEIVGICGVDGNGQSELVKCITGLLHATSGKIEIAGNDVTQHTPKKILTTGIGHIPEDRQSMGMVGQMNLRENIAMVDSHKAPFSTKGLLHWSWIDGHSKKLVEKFSVKTPSILEKAGNLSGGNQQKLVVGRELSRELKLLIAVHPSRGLDIGATKYIQTQIVAARDAGAAVLMVSTELDEILELPDRVLTMYEGRVLACLDQCECSRERLGLLMAGIEENKNDTHNKKDDEEEAS